MADEPTLGAGDTESRAGDTASGAERAGPRSASAAGTTLPASEVESCAGRAGETKSGATTLPASEVESRTGRAGETKSGVTTLPASEVESRTGRAGETNTEDWKAALPESLRSLAGNAQNMAGLEAALKRGQAYTPVTSADEVEIPLPEGADPAQAREGSQWLRDLAVQHGMTNAQVKGLVEGWHKEIAAIPDKLKTRCEKNLRSEWGGDYEAKLAKTEDMVRRLDGFCGGTADKPGALGEVLALGLGNHPDFIKAMAVIAENISDSALPGVSNASGGSEAVSTVEFLEGILK